MLKLLVLTLLILAIGGRCGRSPPPIVVDHIVIGLGLAGSELATLLARDNKSFVAFESRHTYGGRAQSVNIGSYVLPKGGAWQQGGGPQHVLTSRLDTCCIKTIPQNWNSWNDYNEKGESTSASSQELELAYACADQLALDMAAANKSDVDQQTLLLACDWFKETVEDHLAELSTLDFEWAEPPIATSAFGTMPWSTYESPHDDEDNFIIDPRGTEELAGCWLDKYVSGGRYGSSLNYNSSVTKVDTVNKILTLSNGSRYQWRHALFDTRSLAVHQYDVSKNDGKGYKPKLEGDRLLGLLSMHYPVYEKVFFQFPVRFWGNKQIYNIYPTNGLSGSMWHSVDLNKWLPGSRIIYHIISSPDSQRMELLSDAQVADIVLKDLINVFGTIPVPTTTVVSRWINNPSFRGTYSNRPPSLTDNLLEAIFEPFGNGTVMLTGEAYCPRMNGYLHSAILAAQTTYDEWKVRIGEPTVSRVIPRDNVCFTDSPTNLKRNRLNLKHRYNHFNHNTFGRLPDSVFWSKVALRVEIAQNRTRNLIH